MTVKWPVVTTGEKCDDCGYVILAVGKARCGSEGRFV